MFGFSKFEKKRNIARKQFAIDHPEFDIYIDKEPRTAKNKTNTQWVYFFALDKRISLENENGPAESMPESGDNCEKVTSFIYEVDLKNRLSKEIFQDKDLGVSANKFHELHNKLQGIA